MLATYGRTDDVARLLHSLGAQTSKSFELIVVDQNADDRLLPLVQLALGLGLGVHHVKMDRPSLSGARNLGLKLARGEFVAFPDDDCWYEPDTVARAIGAFDTRPEWAAVIANWVEQSEGLATQPQQPELSRLGWRRFRGGHASSISLFIRRSVYETIGGFDEQFGVGRWYGSGEETDFVLRALDSGARIGRCQDIRVHHRFGVAAGGRPSPWAHTVSRARGTGALYIKHRLSWWTMVRGFVSPAVLPLVRGAGLRGVRHGLALSLGRLQGAVRWLLHRRTDGLESRHGHPL